MLKALKRLLLIKIEAIEVKKVQHPKASGIILPISFKRIPIHQMYL